MAERMVYRAEPLSISDVLDRAAVNLQSTLNDVELYWLSVQLKEAREQGHGEVFVRFRDGKVFSIGRTVQYLPRDLTLPNDIDNL